MEVWKSSSEPGAGPTDLVMDLTAAQVTWGFTYVATSGVDQTTRHRNAVQENTDNEFASGLLDALTVNSAADDLVVDFIGSRNEDGPFTAEASGQTVRTQFTYAGSRVLGMSTKAGATTASMQWGSSEPAGTGSNTLHFGWSVKSGSSPPVNTVPPTPRCGTSLNATLISGCSVAAGSSAVTSVTLSCPSGKGTWAAVAQGSASVSGNFTNSITITNGSLTDKNNTLATASWTGASGIHEAVTATLLSSDGTLTDSDNFTIMNDMRELTFTVIEADFDHLQDIVASLQVWLDSGQASATAVATATDDDALEDEQDILIELLSGSIFGSSLVLKRRRRKKKSGN